MFVLLNLTVNYIFYYIDYYGRIGLKMHHSRMGGPITAFAYGGDHVRLGTFATGIDSRLLTFDCIPCIQQLSSAPRILCFFWPSTFT
jgi:hypothetical protein